MRHFSHYQLSQLLPAVERAAIDAGKIQLRDYENQNCVITIKPDRSPVLTTDLECSAFLEKALSAIFPGLPMISEENDTPAPPSGPYVAFDPLDGTAEFIDELKRGSQIKGRFDGRRLGGFSSKVMLMEDGKALIGVVHAAIQGITYSSTLDDFAWRILPSGTRTVMCPRLSDPASPTTRPLKTVFNGKSNPPDLYQSLRHDFAKRSVFLSRTPSTQPGLPRNMRVAERSADLHLGRDGYGWDLAADDLILRNAGGAMFSLSTGQDLRFDQPRNLAGPFIATHDPTLRTKLFPAP